MKKIIIGIVLINSFLSCSTFQKMNISNITKAKSLLETLDSKTPKKEISTLFNLLDINKDGTLGTTEVIGVVEEKFNVLDTDNNTSLNLTELEGILSLL